MESWGRGQQLEHHSPLSLTASVQRDCVLSLLLPTLPKNEQPVPNLISFHVQVMDVSDVCACKALNHHQKTILQAQSYLISLESDFSSSVYKAHSMSP